MMKWEKEYHREIEKEKQIAIGNMKHQASVTALLTRTTTQM